MRGWTRALLLAALACAAVSACARDGEITTPEGARPRMDESAPQGTTPPETDSAGGRWGGFIGSGG